MAEDQETRIRAPPDPLPLGVCAEVGSFVYRFEDTALSRPRDGFDSHTSYLKEKTDEGDRPAGHHVLMVDWEQATDAAEQ